MSNSVKTTILIKDLVDPLTADQLINGVGKVSQRHLKELASQIMEEVRAKKAWKSADNQIRRQILEQVEPDLFYMILAVAKELGEVTTDGNPHKGSKNKRDDSNSEDEPNLMDSTSSKRVRVQQKNTILASDNESDLIVTSGIKASQALIVESVSAVPPSPIVRAQVLATAGAATFWFSAVQDVFAVTAFQAFRGFISTYSGIAREAFESSIYNAVWDYASNTPMPSTLKLGNKVQMFQYSQEENLHSVSEAVIKAIDIECVRTGIVNLLRIPYDSTNKPTEAHQIQFHDFLMSMAKDDTLSTILTDATNLYSATSDEQSHNKKLAPPIKPVQVKNRPPKAATLMYGPSFKLPPPTSIKFDLPIITDASPSRKKSKHSVGSESSSPTAVPRPVPESELVNTGSGPSSRSGSGRPNPKSGNQDPRSGRQDPGSSTQDPALTAATKTGGKNKTPVNSGSTSATVIHLVSGPLARAGLNANSMTSTSSTSTTQSISAQVKRDLVIFEQPCGTFRITQPFTSQASLQEQLRSESLVFPITYTFATNLDCSLIHPATMNSIELRSCLNSDHNISGDFIDAAKDSEMAELTAAHDKEIEDRLASQSKRLHDQFKKDYIAQNTENWRVQFLAAEREKLTPEIISELKAQLRLEHTTTLTAEIRSQIDLEAIKLEIRQQIASTIDKDSIRDELKDQITEDLAFHHQSVREETMEQARAELLVYVKNGTGHPVFDAIKLGLRDEVRDEIKEETEEEYMPELKEQALKEVIQSCLDTQQGGCLEGICLNCRKLFRHSPLGNENSSAADSDNDEDEDPTGNGRSAPPRGGTNASLNCNPASQSSTKSSKTDKPVNNDSNAPSDQILDQNQILSKIQIQIPNQILNKILDPSQVPDLNKIHDKIPDQIRKIPSEASLSLDEERNHIRTCTQNQITALDYSDPRFNQEVVPVMEFIVARIMSNMKNDMDHGTISQPTHPLPHPMTSSVPVMQQPQRQSTQFPRTGCQLFNTATPTPTRVN
jgi:hypothetical protein